MARYDAMLNKRCRVAHIRVLLLIPLLQPLPGCDSPDATTLDEMLNVAPSSLNLGEVYAADVELDVPVFNTSSHPVFVSSVTGSCDCTSITPRCFSIAPEATEHLKLRLNLVGKLGPFSTGITCRVGDASRALTWHLRGHVKPFFRGGWPLPFVRVQYPETTATIRLELAAPVDTLSVSSDAPWLNAEAEIMDDEAVVELQIADDAPFGLTGGQLRFTGLVGDARQPCTVSFPVRIDRVPPYEIRPKILNLGRISPGGTAAASALVSSQYHLSQLKLLSKPDGESVVVENPPDASTDNHHVVLAVQVDKAGPGLQSEIITASAVFDSKEVVITLPLFYYGG